MPVYLHFFSCHIIADFLRVILASEALLVGSLELGLVELGLTVIISFFLVSCPAGRALGSTRLLGEVFLFDVRTLLHSLNWVVGKEGEVCKRLLVFVLAV